MRAGIFGLLGNQSSQANEPHPSLLISKPILRPTLASDKISRHFKKLQGYKIEFIVTPCCVLIGYEINNQFGF
jgi:hypothetical protein